MKICEFEAYFPNTSAVNFGKDDIKVKVIVPSIYKAELYKWLQVSDRVVKVEVTLDTEQKNTYGTMAE